MATDEIGRPDRPMERDRAREILEDATRPASLRAAAALDLARSGGPEVAELLERQLDENEPAVRAAVVRALGESGSPESLDRLRRAGTGAGPAASRRIAFARTLLAHRHRMDRRDDALEELLPEPAEPLVSPPADRARRLRIRPADDDLRAELRRSLELRPLSFPVAWPLLYSWSCGRACLLLALDDDLVSAEDLRETVARPALLGVVARRSPTGRGYPVDRYLLADPGEEPGTAALTAFSPGGRAAAAGSIRVEADRARFSVQGVAGRGNLPLWIEGTFSAGRLDFERALVAGRVALKRAAAPLDRTPR